MADKVGAIARHALSAGNEVSARSAFLRSAQYYDQTLFFILGTRTPEHEAALYRQMDQRWRAAPRPFNPPSEPVRISGNGATMPGYFLSAGLKAQRRTVIVTNGSDAQNVDVYAFGGAAAVERGWNALIFEGPGQGAMLFERKIPFRPDWENVISPIVDFLYDRRGVDTSRIALTGWSFGGALVIRAAAFETRLAAVCADPGYVSDWGAFPASLRGLLRKGATKQEVNAIWQHDVVPHLTPRDRFTLAKRSEIFGPQYLDAAREGRMLEDFWGFPHTVMRYQVADVAARVKVPTLVTKYEHDAFFPGQGQRLYDLLTCPKTLATFTEAEGASMHDAPLAPQRHNQVVFDWLQATMKVPAGLSRPTAALP
ncbi:MAG: alpha/beta hydrolase family protein [Acetobacteraceae bacterium]